MPVRIQVNEYYIQLLAEPTDAEFLRLITKISGIQKQRKRNTYRCSLRRLPEILKELRGITSVLQIPEGLVRRLYDEEMLRRSHTNLLKELGPDMTSDWLWPHQLLGIELAQVNRRYNFFYDTRTGKTLMCLKILYDRLRSGDARRCLVICPSNIVMAWLDDAEKFFPELKVVAYYGDADQKRRALTTPSHVVVWAANKVAEDLEVLKSLNFHTCIFDESSKIKSYKTQIAIATRKLALTIPSWYNLSATPAPNGEYEYYTQMMCLDPYVFNGAVTKFNEKYFNDLSRSRYYPKLRIKPELYDEFMGIIKDYSLFVDQAVMPTAGKEWHTVTFALLPETYRVYDQMREKMSIEVDTVPITVDMIAGMRSKLNQIASGFVMDTQARKANAIDRKLGYTASKTEVHRLGDYSRVELLEKLLDKFPDEQVVIWANFTEEFAMIKELLGDRARYIRGGTSTAEKEHYIYNEFKQRKVQYIVCHPLSVGMGINLTEAHIAIYYSLNDSWEALKQSSERISGHIKVQPHKCQYYVLIADGTVNELIYDNVTNKRDTSTGFLEHLKAEVL